MMISSFARQFIPLNIRQKIKHLQRIIIDRKNGLRFLETTSNLTDTDPSNDPPAEPGAFVREPLEAAKQGR